MQNNRITVNWHPELCCEICGETIHNHFDCPNCGRRYAGTSVYGDAEEGEDFFCEECKTKFIYHGYNDDGDVEIERVNDKPN